MVFIWIYFLNGYCGMETLQTWATWPSIHMDHQYLLLGKLCGAPGNMHLVTVAWQPYLDHQYLFLVKNSSVFLSVVQRSQSQWRLTTAASPAAAAGEEKWGMAAATDSCTNHCFLCKQEMKMKSPLFITGAIGQKIPSDFT